MVAGQRLSSPSPVRDNFRRAINDALDCAERAGVARRDLIATLEGALEGLRYADVVCGPVGRVPQSIPTHSVEREDFTMSNAKHTPKRKRGAKAVPVLGAAGLLSLAGGA